ncbi:MAG: hypothetical protein IJZ68_07885 [Bacteroidaceae bacterium]|nr:hypothetical protein [Bacteroidaceae bacterium]
MRREVKILKSILRQEFPDSNISVRFKCAANYVDGSDKMLVTLDNASFADVRTTLQHYLRNVSVYRYRDIVARGGMCDPYILDPASKEWISLDLCEFIEVKLNGAE